MNNKRQIIINSTIIIITSLIAILLPLSIKNVTNFILCLVIYVMYGFLGILINNKFRKSTIEKNVLNIPVYYYYYIYLIIIYVLVIANKIISINSSILIIMFLILSLALFYIFYSLHIGISKVCKKEDDIKEKSKKNLEWASSIELLINDDNYSSSKKDLEKIYDLIKFSDPIANDLTKEVDDEISKLINSLNDKVDKNKIKLIEKNLIKRKQLIRDYK